MSRADELRAEARACLASPKLSLEFRLLYGITFVSPMIGAGCWYVGDEIAVQWHRVALVLGPFGRNLVGTLAIFAVAEVLARTVLR